MWSCDGVSSFWAMGFVAFPGCQIPPHVCLLGLSDGCGRRKGYNRIVAGCPIALYPSKGVEIFHWVIVILFFFLFVEAIIRSGGCIVHYNSFCRSRDRFWIPLCYQDVWETAIFVSVHVDDVTICSLSWVVLLWEWRSKFSGCATPWTPCCTPGPTGPRWRVGSCGASSASRSRDPWPC